MKSTSNTHCCHSKIKAPLPKTLSFSTLHFSIAFAVAYLLTGSALTGGLIAVIVPTCNTIAFYFHEEYGVTSRKLETLELGYSRAI